MRKSSNQYQWIKSSEDNNTFVIYTRLPNGIVTKEPVTQGEALRWAKENGWI